MAEAQFGGAQTVLDESPPLSHGKANAVFEALGRNDSRPHILLRDHANLLVVFLLVELYKLGGTRSSEIL
jgi:hypothetical protein